MKKLLLQRLQKTAAVLLCALLATGMFACGNNKTAALFINVPTEVQQAECGPYTVPDFEVVDANGEIYAEYRVTLKGAKAPDGADVTLLQDGKAINADKIGTYELTFTAGDAKIADAVLKVAFAKAPPTVTIDEDAEIPAYFFKGVRYSLPHFTYGGGADLTKSHLKIYYTAPDSSNKQEIDLSAGGFTAQHATGGYRIVIHAEGSFGNAKDYEYTVLAADGPSEVVTGKIGYFDQEFGLYQVAAPAGYGDNITTAYDTARKYGIEEGSMKVTFNAWDADFNLLRLQNLLESDVSDYGYLVYRVYNPNAFALRAGYAWFGNTLCPGGVWTEVVYDLSEPLYASGKTTTDITGLGVRVLARDYGELPAGVEFYLSALYAMDVPPSVVPEDEIVQGKIAYFDKAYGVQQVGISTMNGGEMEIDYTVDRYYGDEAGSLKVTHKVFDENNLLPLQNLIEKDVSGYDTLVYRVYNPNAFALRAGYAWFGNTLCPAGVWTEVVADLSQPLSNSGKEPTNITGLAIRILAEDYQNYLPPDTVFYLSALYAEKLVPQEDVVPGKIGYFDKAYGLKQVALQTMNGGAMTVEYDTAHKYETEAGSMKVTHTVGEANNLMPLQNLVEKDVSDYGYLVYRVYNPNSFFLRAGYAWFGGTLCAPGEWTEFRHDLSQPLSNSEKTAADITGLAIWIFSADWNKLPDGTVFYISALYATDTQAELPAEKKVGYFDQAVGTTQLTLKNVDSPFEYSTDHAYGTEAGSLKITDWAVGGYSEITLTLPAVQDITDYQWLVFRVYNDTAPSTLGGVWAWEWNTTAHIPNILQDEWREVRIAVSDITKVGANSATDCAGMTFVFFYYGPLDDGAIPPGSEVYISALYATNASAELPAQRKVGAFDQAVGTTQLTAKHGGSPFEYSTDYAYGTEAGSLKITGWAVGAYSEFTLTLPSVQDITDYQWLVFRVYNDTAPSTLGGVWAWEWNTTAHIPNILQGEWREVRIAVSDITKVGANSATDCAGMTFVFFYYGPLDDGAIPPGSAVYISAMYATNTPA